MRRRLAGAAVAALVVSQLGLTSGSVGSESGIPTFGPTLSTSDRLNDRRYVTTGSRAYVVGTQAGRFPAMGFHTRGEMSGIWTPPIKLLDGVWFGIDRPGGGRPNEWLQPATRFTSGYGHVRMKLPGDNQLRIRRVEFVPDGRRAALIGLEFKARGRQRFMLTVDAHSELMSAYPWGETDPSQLDFNLQDDVRFNGRGLVFRETGKPPVENAQYHDWAALVGSNRVPSGHDTGEAFRGPQDPPVICPPSPDEAPDRCDDTAYGKGAGGQLRYRMDIRPHSTETFWLAVAGSDHGPAEARAELEAALAHPNAALIGKIATRQRLARRSRVFLPGDRLLQRGIEWSKQNLADSVQEAFGLEIRETNAGTNYPPPEGVVPHVRFLGAGFPDYPWLFATDGEYTAFASVAAGQFGPIKDHLRALRDVSLVDNDGSGKVIHEAVTDGSIYFGSNADEGNTDETAKLPSAVALVWRWTGDDAFRDEMYDFAKANMRWIFRESEDDDDDLWPEGLGNVEREGMGEEKLDVTVYTIRGLLDLAAMARSKGDAATATWALTKARRMKLEFEDDWWMPEVPQHADSLEDPGNMQKQQRHWIGVTPMEAELYRSHTVPGLTTRAHGNAALDLRETSCYTGDFGLYHTGSSECDPAPPSTAELVTFTLNTAVMAVGEGNYGRLGPGHQRYYTAGNRRLQLPRPDEQPGAMPEIAPSPDYGRSIDKPFNERAMVLQAWGNYGTLWPVVHQQLGVRPDLGFGRVEVTPQVPPHTRRIAGRNIRLGKGYVDVSAEAHEDRYRTTARLEPAGVELTIGHTIPFRSRVERVMLNGAPVPYRIRITHRDKEVLVEAAAGSRQTLRVKTTG